MAEQRHKGRPIYWVGLTSKLQAAEMEDSNRQSGKSPSLGGGGVRHLNVIGTASNQQLRFGKTPFL